jgi:hypothetical protein
VQALAVRAQVGEAVALAGDLGVGDVLVVVEQLAKSSTPPSGESKFACRP